MLCVGDRGVQPAKTVDEPLFECRGAEPHPALAEPVDLGHVDSAPLRDAVEEVLVHGTHEVALA